MVLSLLLQSLAEWSDSHTAGQILVAQGIDHGRTCHLVGRSSVASEALSRRHHRSGAPTAMDGPLWPRSIGRAAG